MNKVLYLMFLSFFFVFSGSSDAKTVSGRVIMEFDLSSQPHKEATQLWIPYPESSEVQSITDIKVEGNSESSAVYTDKKFQTPMLYAKWDKGTKKRMLKLSFNVSRQEVLHRNLPSKEAAWDRADYALYLAPTSLAPLDGDIKKLALKITGSKKTVLQKAKAIYDWTVENTYRNPDTRGCGKGDVCELIKDPGGKCTDISSIFVALARAAGVPSREVFGIRLGKKSGEDITKWQHCWAEFYLPGYGWVPVDPADVRKMMLKEDLELADNKTREYRDYFWGGVDPYRFKVGEGRDLVLNPVQHGEPVNYLMYPFAQVGEKTLDWLDPKTFSYTITFETDR